MNASKLVRGFGRRFVSLLRRNGRARQYSRLNVESLEERLVPYSFPLMNSTGLDPSQYTVQVLGYSVASQLELLPSATMGQLQWSAFPASLTLPEPTTNGSTTITMSGLNPDVYVTVGSAVSGTGIQAATTVTKITETVTLSQDASGSGTNPLTFNVLSLVGGSATMGSPTIMSLAPPPSTSSLRVGELISGQGIPPGTTVAAVNSNSELTLSQNAQSDETYTGQSPLTLSEQLSGTMNGTDKVTLTGLEASNEIAANDPVSGTNIQANTTVSQIDSVTITLSNGATVTATNPLTFTAQQMGTWIGDTITGISTTSLGVGYSVTGGSIPAGTTITQVNSSSEVTISSSAPSSSSFTVTFPPASGVIPSFDISQYTSFSFDPSVQTAGLNGARVYFFVTPAGWPATSTQAGYAGLPTNPPGFVYIWSGTGFGVQQPNNPPNSPNFDSSYPPYSIVEPTVDPEGSGGALHIDVQTVDGFVFPLTLTPSTGGGTELGQVGQPVPPTGIDRADILSSYASFIPSGSPYLNLVYQSESIDSQAAGILNPGAYLAGGANSGSSLNTIWHPVLAQLYQNTQQIPNYALSMVGDDGDYYKGTLKTLTQLPGGQTGSFNVIDFVGYTDSAETMPNGNEFYIYDPDTADPEAPNYNLSAGYQVFANDGVYNDSSANVLIQQNSNPTPTPTQVALGLERDIVCALNRGVALLGPTDGLKGDDSAYWGTETNWYPYAVTDTNPTHVENLFALFMHTATVGGSTLFTLPTGGGPVTSITSAAESGTTVTITTSAAHNLVRGQQVEITGVSVAGYNGTFTITGTTATTFTFTDANGLASASGGTATGGAVPDAAGTLMDQAYGFAYDESPPHGPGYNQPNVPSKFDPTPSGTAALAIDVGPWAGAVVTGVNPNSGSVSGGTLVTISGSGFIGATQVDFGALQVPAAGFTVNQAGTSISVISPAAAAAGTVDVTVITSVGPSPTSPVDQFTYQAAAAAAPPTVSGISVASGPASGDVQEVIRGSNFTRATAVHFGSTEVLAPHFGVNAAGTTITLLSPEHAAGTVDVTVTTSAGTSSTSATDRFTYRSDIFAVGSGAGVRAQVNVYSSSLRLLGTIFPFGDFKGGVRVAVGDVTGGGVQDVIVAEGPGGAGLVKVYNGDTFALIREFTAFPLAAAVRQGTGVYVAAADLTQSGYADIVVGSDAGWLPLVAVYNGKTGALVKQFLAFARSFRGGVRVAAGADQNGSSEVVAATGTGSQVTIFSGYTFAELVHFNPYARQVNTHGVFVALAPVDGTGVLDLITGTGPRFAAEPRVFDALTGRFVSQIYVGPRMTSGVRVGAFDAQGSGSDDVLIGSGPGQRATVALWQYSTARRRWLEVGIAFAFANRRGDSIS